MLLSPASWLPQLLHWSLSHSGTSDIRHSGRQSSSEISRQTNTRVNPRAPAKNPEFVLLPSLSSCNPFWNGRLTFKSLMLLSSNRNSSNVSPTFCSCFCRLELWLSYDRHPSYCHERESLLSILVTLHHIWLLLCTLLNAIWLQDQSLWNVKLLIWRVLKNWYRVEQEGYENRFWRWSWWIISPLFPSCWLIAVCAV